MRLCALQMSVADLTENIEAYNIVAKAKACGHFDQVCVVAPDMASSVAVVEQAERWGVDIFLGAVENVAKRFDNCCRKYGADTVARIIPLCFFCDLDLVKRMMDRLEDNPAVDLLRLPRNFDIRFGADVTRASFFAKALDHMAALDDPQPGYAFNPWGFAEAHDGMFESLEFTDTPTRSAREFETLARQMHEAWPEHWDKMAMPNRPYAIALELAAERFPPQPELLRVLDLACGSGDGTARMAALPMAALGVDIDQTAIKSSLAKFGDQPNLEFLCQDYRDLEIDACSLELVVSVHTMEHVPDDTDFLTRIAGWLKPEGYLVLEVPLLMELPFAGVTTPISPYHVREYMPEELVELFSRFFELEDAFGVSRGLYLEQSKARNAMLLIGKVRKKVRKDGGS